MPGQVDRAGGRMGIAGIDDERYGPPVEGLGDESAGSVTQVKVEDDNVGTIARQPIERLVARLGVMNCACAGIETATAMRTAAILVCTCMILFLVARVRRGTKTVAAVFTAGIP